MRKLARDEVTIIQERLDTPQVPKVMGGVPFRFWPTFQVYLPLVLRAASVPEIIKDASNLIHQVEVGQMCIMKPTLGSGRLISGPLGGR